MVTNLIIPEIAANSTKTRISSKWACDKELTLFVEVAAISPLKSTMNFDLFV